MTIGHSDDKRSVGENFNDTALHCNVSKGFNNGRILLSDNIIEE